VIGVGGEVLVKGLVVVFEVAEMGKFVAWKVSVILSLLKIYLKLVYYSLHQFIKLKNI
jgi:hypothetical protein